MVAIKTYLCPKKLPATNEDIRSTSGTSFDEDSGVLKTYLVSPSCTFNPVVFSSLISENALATNENFYTCLEDLIGAGELNWERDVLSTELPNGDVNVTHLSHITIDINKPEMLCFYSGVFVYGVKIDPADRRELFSSVVSHDGGRIGTQSDFETDIKIENYQTLFVPGELLQLAWRLYINGTIYYQPVYGKYFATPSVTGGEIVQKNTIGDYIVSYVINSQGRDIACVPTDYAEYVVGDWVYLLKQGATSAETCVNERQSAFTDSDVEFSGFGAEDELYTGEIAELLMSINSSRGDSGLDLLETNKRLQRAAEELAETLSEDEDADLNGLIVVSESGYLDGVMISGEDYDVHVLSAYGYHSVSAVIDHWKVHSSSTLYDSSVEDFAVAIEDTEYGHKAYVAVFAYREGSRDWVVPANNFRLIPMTVNNEGNESADFTTLDYDMLSGFNFRKFFEMSVHTGTITEIFHESNQATVEIIEDEEDEENGETGINGTFNNVEIFYHCEGRNTADNGHVAFSVGDEVLLINETGTCSPEQVKWGTTSLKIVGFKDGRKPCGSHKIIVSTDSGNAAVAWDLATNSQMTAISTKENVISDLEDKGFVSRKSSAPANSMEVDFFYFIGDEFDGPMNLPIIGTWTKETTEPYGNANSETGARYFPVKTGEQYKYTHKWVENEDGDYRAPYLINIGGNGLTANFQSQSILSCDPETYNGGLDEWESRDIVDWTRLYYHGMFHQDTLADYQANFLNCEQWYELLFDSWSDCDWWCASDSNAPMNEYNGTGYDGNIISLWRYDQWTDTPYYRGPVPSIAAAWVDVMQTKNANCSLLAEIVRVAADVDVHWTDGDDEIYDVNTEECSTCGDPTITPKYRIPVLRIYAKVENILPPQMEVLRGLINKERTDRGLSELEINLSLVEAAEVHAQYIADNQLTTHNGPGRTHVGHRAHDANYFLYMLKTDGTVVEASDVYDTYTLLRDPNGDCERAAGVGENIFAVDINTTYEEPHTYELSAIETNGTILQWDHVATNFTLEDVVYYWMQSPGHRENIINEEFTEMGLGAVRGEDGATYFCNTFGFRCNHWPGYTAIDTTELKSKLESEFSYSEGDDILKSLTVDLV